MVTSRKQGVEMAVNLTEKERELVLRAINCYIDIMGAGEETIEIIDEELDEGLRTAIKKFERMKTRG